MNLSLVHLDRLNGNHKGGHQLDSDEFMLHYFGNDIQIAYANTTIMD